MKMIAYGILVCCWIAASAAAEENARRRTWTSGSHSVDARFISSTGGTVTLERVDNGRRISIQLEQLSEDDQEFIRERRWLKAETRSPFSETDNRQRWINTSYSTQIYHVKGREWAEIDRDGKSRWSKPLIEIGRSDEYVELRNADTNHVWRIFGPRMEVQEEGRWRWIASGRWDRDDKESASPQPKAIEVKPESLWSGFRGIAWGTNIASIPDMTLVSDDERGDTVYIRKGDNLTIGDANLKVISYGFYKDEFYSVVIIARDPSNWQGLRDATFARYGKGRQQNQFVDEYIWSGDNVFMQLKYSRISKKVTLGMLYTPIADRKNEDEKRRAIEAGEDF